MKAMRTKTLTLTIIIMLILSLSLNAQIYTAKTAEKEFEVKDAYWIPPFVIGANNTFTVVLSYNGENKVDEIRAWLNATPITMEECIIEDSYNGTIVNGQSVSLSFNFKIPVEAKASHYKLKLKIQYEKNEALYVQEEEVETTVRGIPNLSLSSNTEEIERGAENEIEIKIANNGDGTARHINVILNPTSPLATIIGENTKEKDILSVGEEWTFKIKLIVEGYAESSTSIMAMIIYLDQFGNVYNSTNVIGFKIVGSKTTLKLESENETLNPNSINKVQIKITNIGEGKAEDISITLYTQNPQVLIVGASSYYKEELSPNESWSFQVSIYVQPGVYGAVFISASITYKDEAKLFHALNAQIGFKVSSSEATLMLKSENSTLKPDCLNNVTLTVTNIGEGKAEDIIVSLYTQNPQVSIIGVASYNREKLNPSESWSFQVSIYVQPGVYGAVFISASILYKDEADIPHTLNVQVGFNVKAEASIAISKISYTPPTVFPGDKETLITIILTNIGDYSAENVSLKLYGISGVVKASYLGSETALIPYIPVGGVVEVRFLVDIKDEAKPGYYEIPLEVSHNNEQYNLTVSLTIREKAKPVIEDVIFKPQPKPGLKGVKITLTIKNNSNATAESLRITISSPYISGSTMTFIGRLPAGESRTTVLEVDFSSDTPIGSLPIEVSFDWNQEERSLSETQTLNIEISERQSLLPPNYALIGISIAIVIAAVLAVFFLRRF